MISAFMWGAGFIRSVWTKTPVYLLIAGLATIIPFIYFNLLIVDPSLVSVGGEAGLYFRGYGMLAYKWLISGAGDKQRLPELPYS